MTPAKLTTAPAAWWATRASCSANSIGSVGERGAHTTVSSRVVLAAELIQRVVEHVREHGEAVLTPPVEPGRLTISVRPATPHTPRDSTEVGTCGSPDRRIASARPGIW